MIVRNDSFYDYELCDSGGNSCFWEKMKDTVAMTSDCFCLSDCTRKMYSLSKMLEPRKKDECYGIWNDKAGNSPMSLPIPLINQRTLILLKNLEANINVSNWSDLEDKIMQDYSINICEKIKSKFPILNAMFNFHEVYFNSKHT